MTLFKGSIPALITPMNDDLTLDEEAFSKFVEFQIKSGSHALVPVGTTGESATLTHDEHRRIIDICIKVSNGRVPVMAGTGSNNTVEAIELTRYAKDAGADAVLIVVPYYNKPSQEGMYQHFMAIATAVDIPICIYNIPGRSVVKMEPSTIKRLHDAMLNSFFATKDATGEPSFTKEVLDVIGGDFYTLCGDDGLMHEFHKNGSVGCISVTANIAPKMCADMHNALMAGDFDTFTAINSKLMKLHNAIFHEPNPCPAKYACMKLGIIPTDAVRLPMIKISASTKALVDEALLEAGLLQT